ncbi:MAG: glycosyltransferase [Bacteroidales bacterium]|nr:glycosyltransferase [Bacteroidales bacterium]
MEISIIIPTCNRNKILLKTIENTLEILPKITSKYEIIVINDGKEEFLFYHPNVKIYQNTKKGVASARNYGVSLSTYENLLLLDDDILLSYDALMQYKIFFKSSSSYNHCLNIKWKYTNELINKCKKTNFGRYLITIGYVEMKGWMNNEHWIENSEYIVPNLASFALGLKKQIFKNVGGYNESFPYSGFEDFDFSLIINKQGIKVLLNTTHTVFHNEEDRIEPNSWLQRRYREGATRAVYVKLTKDKSFEIRHFFVKKIIFSIIYRLNKILVFKTKLLNFSRIFDFISFAIFNALAGAYIWKGYHDYEKKN